MNLAFQSTSSSPLSSAAELPRPMRASRWNGLTAALAGLFRAAAQQVPRLSGQASRQRRWAGDFNALVVAGDAMIQRARRDKQAMTVAVFDLSDLPELRSVFGKRVTQEVVQRVSELFQRIATSKGLVARTGATMFTVLMPGFGRDRALAVISEVMGYPCRIELDASRDEIVLIPEYLVQTVRGDTGSVADVIAALKRGIVQARELEQSRRRYLKRERESHTRPGDVRAVSTVSAATAASTARAGELRPQVDSAARRHAYRSVATIPMPLAARSA
jgi:GGDEF domain-containing protein